MIPTLANTEFLPTNTSAFDSPLIYVGFVIAVLAVIGSILWYHLMEDDVTFIFIGLVIGFIAVALPFMGLSNASGETNRNNLTENIKTVYDIENVMFEDESTVAEKIAEPSPLTITVTKDGKAYKVILNQDKKTFEPNLSSFETDTIDIETLKRDK